MASPLPNFAQHRLFRPVRCLSSIYAFTNHSIHEPLYIAFLVFLYDESTVSVFVAQREAVFFTNLDDFSQESIDFLVFNRVQSLSFTRPDFRQGN